MNDYSMSARRTECRGVALITVLLGVALLTAVVSRLSLSNEVWMQQVEGGAALAKANQASRAAQQWVELILEQDTNPIDAHTDLWSQSMPPVPIDRGTLYVRIEDMQGRFNLNNLVKENGKHDGAAIKQFRRLLEILELNPALAEAVVDWIDPDGHRAGAWGAEDGHYIGLDPPYLAANQPFATAVELRLVRGVDRSSWQRLEPHVTTLPVATPVNINAVTPEVLAAVMTGWGPPLTALGRAQRWAEEARSEPAADLEAFAEQALDPDYPHVLPELAVRSKYFMAHTEVGFDNVLYRMATLYERRQGRADVLHHVREIR